MWQLIKNILLWKNLINVKKKQLKDIFKYKKNDPVHIQYKVYIYDTNFNLVNKFKTNKECAEYLIN